jgi:predicted nucleotidyltransferase
MRFQVERKTKKKEVQGGDAQLAKAFGKLMRKELGDFVKAIVLFGSVARGEDHLYEPDIDVLIIVDDLTLVLSAETVETYRVITEKTAARVSGRLHITTMKLTNFWEHVRNGDPLAVNVLRDGISLYDSGFYEPIQELLHTGKIKPTKESIYNHYARAPMTLHNADWHVTQGALDLYWAILDAAQAALMSIGHVSPSPRHMTKMMKQELVNTKKLHPRYIRTMDKFFTLHKDISHRKISQVKGKEFDKLRVEADDFISQMQQIIAAHHPK